MSRIRYTEEFKRDAVSQVVDRGYSILEVSKRLGVTTKSLYDWVQRFSKPTQNQIEDAKLESESRRLKAELARVTEERDILNLEGSNSLGNCFPRTRRPRIDRQGIAQQCPERLLRGSVKVRYAFIYEHRLMFRIRSMCRVLNVHPSGFYAWFKNPLSIRGAKDQRQSKLLKEAWEDSGKVYGVRAQVADRR